MRGGDSAETDIRLLGIEKLSGSIVCTIIDRQEAMFPRPLTATGHSQQIAIRCVNDKGTITGHSIPFVLAAIVIHHESGNIGIGECHRSRTCCGHIHIEETGIVVAEVPIGRESVGMDIEGNGLRAVVAALARQRQGVLTVEFHGIGARTVSGQRSHRVVACHQLGTAY